MAVSLQKISSCLWFDREGEAAAKLYCSIFPNSQMGDIVRYPKGGHDPKREGEVLTVEFQLAGQSFTALNGGPHFTFSEAISFQVLCDDQAEVDRYWKALLGDGGKESQCGWLKDRFGLSWQIVPRRLLELFKDKDPNVVERVNAAMLQMVKLDIATLEAAAKG